MKPCIGVWVAMCNIYTVIVVLKAKGKRKCAIVPPKLPLHIIGKIAYFSALPHPSHALEERSFLGIDQRFHADIVEAIRFEQIDNVKSILYVLAGVRH